MYNHPYFKKNIPAIIPMTSNPTDRKLPSVYHPELVDMHKPSWSDGGDRIAKIAKTFTSVRFDDFDGCFVGPDGDICNSVIDDKVKDNVIHAVIITPNVSDDEEVELTNVQLINTQNAGFRYVTNVDNRIMDLGPVKDTCIVGNYYRPEGMYVPLSNLKAVADAAVLLSTFIENQIIANNTNDIGYSEDEMNRNFIPDPDGYRI